MATNAALGASGLSFALGVMNSRNLNTLTEEVEKMKKSMTESKVNIDNPELDSELAGDLGGIDSPAEVNRKSIADVVAKLQALEGGMQTIATSAGNVDDVATDVTSIATKFDALDAEVQGILFEVENVVGLQPDIEDIVKKWRKLETKAYVDDDLRFHANDCKIGLVKDVGHESAIHFAGSGDPNWSMYMAGPSGKGPDGKAPPTHSGVKGNALRLRVGNGATDGLVVENSNRQGVFSVRSNGQTTMGSLASGDLNADTVGTAHVDHHSPTGFAFAQKKDGTTLINSAEGRGIGLGNNGATKVVVEGSPNRTLTLKNNADAHDTHFNLEGNNYVRCGAKNATVFRVGKDSTDKMFIDKDGTHVKGLLTVDGVNVNPIVKGVPGQVASLINSVKSLEARLKVVETNYIDSRRRIHLRNHAANKYLNSNGDVITSKASTSSRFDIEH